MDVIIFIPVALEATQSELFELKNKYDEDAAAKYKFPTNLFTHCSQPSTYLLTLLTTLHLLLLVASTHLLILLTTLHPLTHTTPPLSHSHTYLPLFTLPLHPLNSSIHTANFTHPLTTLHSFTYPLITLFPHSHSYSYSLTHLIPHT